MKTKRWHVYLLRCADGTLYCGVTNDLPRRLAAHLAGKGAKYTRPRRPVKLAWSVRVRDKSAALKREHAVKALSRGQKLRLISVRSTASASGKRKARTRKVRA